MGGVVWSKGLCGKSGTTVAGYLWFCVFAIVAFLLTAGCGSDQDSNASSSFQQEVQALKTELAQSEMRRSESSEELYARVEDLSEKISTLTESNAALRQEVRALSSEIEAAKIQEEASTGGTDANADVAVSAPRSASHSNFCTPRIWIAPSEPWTTSRTSRPYWTASGDSSRNNTLVVSSGDNYIPGPRYYAAGDDSTAETLGVSANGRGDIALLNAMGFQASAVGNHELDHGTGNFANIIGSQIDDGRTYPGATFPYLSSNLDLLGRLQSAQSCSSRRTGSHAGGWEPGRERGRYHRRRAHRTGGSDDTDANQHHRDRRHHRPAVQTLMTPTNWQA